MGESYSRAPGLHRSLEGDVKTITQIEMVSQSPIGKSSRSNPVTYVKAYDTIRSLMAGQQLSKIRGFKPKHFSFQITYSIGGFIALASCFWFYFQSIEGRNAVYATAVLIGCGSSIMLATSLSMIAELIGEHKVT